GLAKRRRHLRREERSGSGAVLSAGKPGAAPLQAPGTELRQRRTDPGDLFEPACRVFQPGAIPHRAAFRAIARGYAAHLAPAHALAARHVATFSAARHMARGLAQSDYPQGLRSFALL